MKHNSIVGRTKTWPLDLPKSICLRDVWCPNDADHLFFCVSSFCLSVFSIYIYTMCVCVECVTNQQFHESRLHRIKKHYRDYAARACMYQPTQPALYSIACSAAGWGWKCGTALMVGVVLRPLWAYTASKQPVERGCENWCTKSPQNSTYFVRRSVCSGCWWLWLMDIIGDWELRREWTRALTTFYSIGWARLFCLCVCVSVFVVSIW